LHLCIKFVEDISFRIVTIVRPRRATNIGLFPVTKKRFSLFRRRPDRLWGYRYSYFMCNGAAYSKDKEAEALNSPHNSIWCRRWEWIPLHTFNVCTL